GFSVLVVLGYPRVIEGRRFNMAGIIQGGTLVYEYAKQCLPTYQVFDEYRYFTPGTQAGIYRFKVFNHGLQDCEDIWDGGPLAALKKSGSDLMLNLNGSPFHASKQKVRLQLVSTRAKDLDVPIVYVNQVGGQDELVF